MANKISVPRGTADILPTDISLWQDIETKSKNLFKVFNYKEIRTPVFEETGLFQRSLGQTSDVVNKQLLQLAGDKKEGFSLRPEGTASIVRTYIQNGLDRKDNLSKLFYIGPMFRGERPQKGRLRQFHQIGAEAIGADTCSPYLDAEMIHLAVSLLEGFGLNGFKLKINTLGSAKDKDNFAEILRENLKNHKSDLCETCQDRFDRNVFRILDCKNESCQAIVDKIDVGQSYLSTESQKYFSDVCSSLHQLGIKYEICPKLVRGLDYYTHTVFEISESSLGSQDALGAGGRYGDLVKQLGGPQVDAVGFALGIERIILALNKKTESQSVIDAFIVALDQTAAIKAVEIAHALRMAGVITDMSFKVSSIKSQMRLANKLNAQNVLILGEDEIKNNSITLKNMETSEQENVSVDDNFENLINKCKK